LYDTCDRDECIAAPHASTALTVIVTGLATLSITAWIVRRQAQKTREYIEGIPRKLLNAAVRQETIARANASTPAPVSRNGNVVFINRED
jgi:hypothetical protein